MLGKSSKDQHPSSREAPNFKLESHPQALTFGAWLLVLLWCLELGDWSLVAGLIVMSEIMCNSPRLSNRIFVRAPVR
jgi:hypothetical protein